MNFMTTRRATLILLVLLALPPLRAAELSGETKPPVADAIVAAVPVPAKRMTGVAATTRTDAEGRFRFAALAPGTYALTATSAALTAGYVAPLAVAEGTPAHATIAMGGDGKRLRGVVHRPDGKPARARLFLGRISNVEGDTFVADAGDDGRYDVLLPPATYFFNAEGRESESVAESVELTADATRDVTVIRTYAAVPAAAASWIREKAIPLATAEAGHGFDDMEPLRAVVGSARVVALGEATHGTREFFQLKHRMLEFLVEKLGFTVFAIEASFPDAETVNDYVLTGKGDPAAALAGLGFWTWNTDEVLDLIRWMRRYNEDPAHAAKLKFYGFDMQVPEHSAARLREYFKKVDPDRAGDPTETLGPLLEEHRAEYVARSSNREWALAGHHAALMKLGPRPSIAQRDKAMAENIVWILGEEPAGTKIVLWAHNGHVATTPIVGTTSMGSHLRKFYGEAMRNFVFAFDRGDFNAVDGGPTKRGVVKHSVTAAPPASFDGALAANGPPLFALDLRTARGAARDWLDSLLANRSIGALFRDSAGPQAYFAKVRPLQMADAVLFVRETTPSHLRPKPAPPVPLPPPAHSPANPVVE
jgi:erythromycin esterase